MTTTFIRRTKLGAAGMVVAAAATTAAMFGGASTAGANTPCSQHSLSSGCAASSFSYHVNCVGPGRIGPGITGYATHGTASGDFILYKTYDGEHATGNFCGVPKDTGRWLLSSSLWVTAARIG